MSNQTQMSCTLIKVGKRQISKIWWYFTKLEWPFKIGQSGKRYEMCKIYSAFIDVENY